MDKVPSNPLTGLFNWTAYFWTGYIECNIANGIWSKRDKILRIQLKDKKWDNTITGYNIQTVNKKIE